MIKKRMAGPICDQGPRTGDGEWVEGGGKGGWVGERRGREGGREGVGRREKGNGARLKRTH